MNKADLEDTIAKAQQQAEAHPDGPFPLHDRLLKEASDQLAKTQEQRKQALASACKSQLF